MAPSYSCISSQLRQLIYYHIDNNLLQNALFFAERYIAYDQRNLESAYLLSHCYLRLGDNASAYEYSKSAGLRGAHLGCAYVFAQACLALERYKEGINALEKSRNLWLGKNSFGRHSSSSRQPLADAAAVNCLLGKLYSGWDNKSKAISYFEDALKLNPFIWDAFTSLCDMGVNIRVSNIFKMNPEIEAILKINYHDHNEKLMHHKDTKNTSNPNLEQKRNLNRPNSVVIDNLDPFNNLSAKGTKPEPFGTLDSSRKLGESNSSSSTLPSSRSGSSNLETIETPNGPSVPNDKTTNSNRHEFSSVYSTEPPQAPIRKTRTTSALGMDLGMDIPKMSRSFNKRAQRFQEAIEEPSVIQALRPTSVVVTSIGDRKRTISGQVVPRHCPEDLNAPQRRSVRLFQKQPIISKSLSISLPNVAAPERELKKAKPPVSRIVKPCASFSSIGRQASGNNKISEDNIELDHREVLSRSQIGITSNTNQKIYEAEILKQEEAVKTLLELSKKIGNGYYALARYQCSEALQIFNSLPRTHRESPMIMTQIGRAYYEQAAYGEAEKVYKRLRQIAPTRFEDMEIFSTILWHLKRETDLAFLAHELINASWKSPQAWCVLGNSWSLARDHEQALKCFKRATQLNPKFAYAFTLQGHEHVANEEYDKALVSYRFGMAADKRHYNAWYGVGRVYEKLGKYDKAFVHFSAATAINPTNAVLICCIGTVLEKQKKPRQALQYFTRATELAPRSALTRFKKARTLMSIAEYEKAQAELMILKNIAPEEAMVHFLLGKLYKCLKEKGLAVRHFTIALNLDPKASQQIKEAIESLEYEDENDESLMAC
ncbi:putative 20s cyclosome subunit (nuc2 cdc27) protein [Erysiphe necator]|uniref:Putative 20s cyclosome subunit (Nuc2 cdc27) protein n=1 Tax=Uncinula necator TaxID=52586 RepID=A0A0B1P677_UNCNE|nr:putative 20s cyclosome subunit (nuc2 cdc27) protein [Erysiphe necator]